VFPRAVPLNEVALLCAAVYNLRVQDSWGYPLRPCNGCGNGEEPMGGGMGGTLWRIMNIPSGYNGSYTTMHKAGKDDSDERVVAVLELPPIVSPETAVRAAIVAETRGKK
jgi:hypothetical protein